MSSPAPLVVLVGPTASGKTALSLALARQFRGEIVSCDSVAIYRGLDIGSAKPSSAERSEIPHHGLDLLDPDQPTTAGDYARNARQALAAIANRQHLPIVTGGTGLYLRALLDGLAPAPPRDEALRDRLRQHAARHGSPALHRLLRRRDPAAAQAIHPNDTPKLIRALEVTLLARRPQTQQWTAGRDPLTGFAPLQIGLNPPREALYTRINSRAEAMFHNGLLEETASIAARYGDDVRSLGSLGYAQALAVLHYRQSLPAAIAEAQQGHRNYAKRQLTWFRRDPRIEWYPNFGDDPATAAAVTQRVQQHLNTVARETTA